MGVGRSTGLDRTGGRSATTRAGEGPTPNAAAIAGALSRLDGVAAVDVPALPAAAAGPDASAPGRRRTASSRVSSSLRALIGLSSSGVASRPSRLRTTSRRWSSRRFASRRVFISSVNVEMRRRTFSAAAEVSALSETCVVRMNPSRPIDRMTMAPPVRLRYWTATSDSTAPRWPPAGTAVSPARGMPTVSPSSAETHSSSTTAPIDFV